MKTLHSLSEQLGGYWLTSSRSSLAQNLAPAVVWLIG